MSGRDYREELAKIITNTVKAQNVDWLAADFQLKRAGNLCRISVAGTTVKVKLVPSSGSSITLVTLTGSGVINTFEVALDQGRTWNFQTDDGAGITVNFLCVQEVQA